ncbi:spermine synthase-like [Styela clava]
MDSWLLEFQMDMSKVHGKVDEFLSQIGKLMKHLDIGCILVYSNTEKHISALFSNDKGLNVFLQSAKNGLLTLDIHTTSVENAYFKNLVNELDEKVRKLEFAEIPKTPPYDSLPAMKRGREFSHYDIVHGIRLVERDFDKLVFDEVTSRQHLRVLHSIEFGNCLYCDNDITIGEYDYESYSHALSGFGHVDYNGKRVLILGGGDACIIRRIKDMGSTMITAVEYDQRVVDVTKLYFREICGNLLDSMTGPNYEIVIEDAAEYLEKAVKTGLEFDVVINDIATIPLSLEPVGERWEFNLKLLANSMEVLKHDGVFVSHGTSASRLQGQKVYEAQLEKLEYPIKFTKEIGYIPTYQENWVVYIVWKKSS